MDEGAQSAIMSHREMRTVGTWVMKEKTLPSKERGRICGCEVWFWFGLVFLVGKMKDFSFCHLYFFLRSKARWLAESKREADSKDLRESRKCEIVLSVLKSL